MTRAATKIKVKKAAKEQSNSDLIEALNFISCAQTSSGLLNESHCLIANGWVMANNGSISAGHKINLDLHGLAPRTDRLVAALNRTNGKFAISSDDKSISIASGKFTVRVPCAAPEFLSILQPNINPIAAEDGFLEACNRVAGLAKEIMPSILESSVRSCEGSVIASDRHIVFEAWHGWQGPTMILPKLAIAILCKHKGLTGIACNPNGLAATFWFGPDKWITVPFYHDDWPNFAPILDVSSNPKPIGETLIEAVKCVLPHSEDGHVHFTTTGVMSSSAEACYEIDGLEPNLCFNGEKLLKALEKADKFDFTIEGKCLFFGDNFRGALAWSEE